VEEIMFARAQHKLATEAVVIGAGGIQGGAGGGSRVGAVQEVIAACLLAEPGSATNAGGGSGGGGTGGMPANGPISGRFDPNAILPDAELNALCARDAHDAAAFAAWDAARGAEVAASAATVAATDSPARRKRIDEDPLYCMRLDDRFPVLGGRAAPPPAVGQADGALGYGGRGRNRRRPPVRIC
jgi:hypothetical protein